MNIDYSQFYRGTTNIPSYGNGTYKKDTLVKYEFNTTDEHGNKIGQDVKGRNPAGDEGHRFAVWRCGYC